MTRQDHTARDPPAAAAAVIVEGQNALTTLRTPAAVPVVDVAVPRVEAARAKAKAGDGDRPEVAARMPPETTSKGDEMNLQSAKLHGEPVADRSLRILLASGQNERFSLLAAGLWTSAEVLLHQVGSGEEVLHLLGGSEVDLVIVDERLGDCSGLDLVRHMARCHPFVNCMLVSDLEGERFHEMTEGLGVLMQLPSPPRMETARSIVEHLATIRSSWNWI